MKKNNRISVHFDDFTFDYILRNCRQNSLSAYVRNIVDEHIQLEMEIKRAEDEMYCGEEKPVDEFYFDDVDLSKFRKLKNEGNK